MVNYVVILMVKKDRLFELIKSLSKSEKRYFKLFCSSESGKSNYLKLFDAIDKQEVYNERIHQKTFFRRSASSNNCML